MVRSRQNRTKHVFKSRSKGPQIRFKRPLGSQESSETPNHHLFTLRNGRQVFSSLCSGTGPKGHRARSSTKKEEKTCRACVFNQPRDRKKTRRDDKPRKFLREGLRNHLLYHLSSKKLDFPYLFSLKVCKIDHFAKKYFFEIF